MAHIPGIEKARVEQALCALRAIRSDVEAALDGDAPGTEPKPLSRTDRHGNPLDLDDVRAMLKKVAAGRNSKGERQEPAVRLDYVDPDTARTLLDIANATRHDSDRRWRPGDDMRAERIVDSILARAGVRLPRAFATLPGRHSEAFELGEKQIRHCWYPKDFSASPSGWSAWATMKCSLATSIAAVGSRDSIDVFILAGGHIDYRRWQLDGDPALPPRERTGHWQGWKSLPVGGCKVLGPIHAISLEPGHRELFAYGENGEPVHRWSWHDDWVDWHPFMR